MAQPASARYSLQGALLRIALLFSSAAFIGYLAAKGKFLMLAALASSAAYGILLVRSPRSAFLVWVLLSPLGERLVRYPMEGALITFDRLCIGLVFFYLIIRVLVTKKRDLLPAEAPEKSMLLFSLWLLLSSIFFSRAGLGAIRYATDTILLSFMSYYVAKNLFREERDFQVLTKYLTFVACYLCAIGIFEWVTKSDFLPYKIPMRVAEFAVKANGPFRQHYAYGMVQIVLFFVVVYRAVLANWSLPEKKKAAKILFFSLLFLGLLLNVYSNLSRGRWLGFLAGLTVWSFLHRPPGKARFLKVGSLLLVIATCILALTQIYKTQLFKQRIENRENVYARLAAWQAIIDQVKAHPVTGIGYRNLQDVLEKNRNLYRYRGVRGLESSHNSYLQFLAELGLIGLGLFLLVLFSLAKIGLRYKMLSFKNLNDRAWQACVFAIFVAFLLPAVFANTLYSIEYPNKLFFLLFGATAGRLWKLREKNDGLPGLQN